MSKNASRCPEYKTHWGISLEQMAWRKSHRYLIERSHQDAIDELGWDEFQAR
jgi:hypothetical protein